MGPVVLTDRYVQGLKPPAKGQSDYRDAKLPGFGVRVSQGGTKSFYVVYRAAGRQRRHTLGDYRYLKLAQARSLAREVLRGAADGNDPAEAKRRERSAMRFGELCELYLAEHARLKKRSWQEDERIVRKELAKWFKIPVAGFQRRDVRDILSPIIARKSPVMANRTLALLRKVFGFAMEQDILENNPCSGIRLPSRERPRDRVLSTDEIRSVWEALAMESLQTRSLFQLSLYTAQRSGELRTMRWSELDAGEQWWTIPGDRSKNGLQHRVPLSREAQLVLKRLRLSCPSKTWVFPGPTDEPRATIQKAKDRISLRAGVEFRFHDLRRTAASHMASAGVSRDVIGKILNHAETGVTAVYDRHSYDPQKKEALDAWGRALGAMVAVKLRSAR